MFLDDTAGRGARTSEPSARLPAAGDDRGPTRGCLGHRRRRSPATRAAADRDAATSTRPMAVRPRRHRSRPSRAPAARPTPVPPPPLRRTARPRPPRPARVAAVPPPSRAATAAATAPPAAGDGPGRSPRGAARGLAGDRRAAQRPPADQAADRPLPAGRGRRRDRHPRLPGGAGLPQGAGRAPAPGHRGGDRRGHRSPGHRSLRGRQHRADRDRLGRPRRRSRRIFADELVDVGDVS